MRNIMILILLFFTLSSHELFLKTDDYFLEPGTQSILYLFNGTFSKSENVITRDRITGAKVLGPQYTFTPANTDYYDEGEVTFLRMKSGPAGTYTAGISTLPRVIDLDAQAFNDYLYHEGLTDVLKDRKARGIDGQPAREQYAKHVKAILQVGDKRTADYAVEFGYPIEFVPLANPYTITSGESLSIQLIAGGKPLPGQVVRYGVDIGTGENNPGLRTMRTDKNGVITLQINDPGKWFIATIHMVETSEAGLDYISEWATLTFEVR